MSGTDNDILTRSSLSLSKMIDKSARSTFWPGLLNSAKKLSESTHLRRLFILKYTRIQNRLSPFVINAIFFLSKEAAMSVKKNVVKMSRDGPPTAFMSITRGHTKLSPYELPFKVERNIY